MSIRLCGLRSPGSSASSSPHRRARRKPCISAASAAALSIRSGRSCRVRRRRAPGRYHITRKPSPTRRDGSASLSQGRRYEITNPHRRFADATRARTLTAGSAFELPSRWRSAAGRQRDRQRRGGRARGGRSPDRGDDLPGGGQALPMTAASSSILRCRARVSPSNVATTQLFARRPPCPARFRFGSLAISRQFHRRRPVGE